MHFRCHFYDAVRHQEGYLTMFHAGSVQEAWTHCAKWLSTSKKLPEGPHEIRLRGTRGFEQRSVWVLWDTKE